MATPTRATKRLGGFLAEVRKAAGYDLLAPAKLLKVTDSTLSRYETGTVMPVWPTVLTLLNIYGADEEQYDRANQLWDDAKAHVPPVRLPAGTPKAFRQLINAEREAEEIRTVEPSLIPGLLQTGDYTRSLAVRRERSMAPEVPRDNVVSTRQRRQERLVGHDAVRLHAIVDEAALHRFVGGPDVLREQLEYLIEAGNRPNVTIQVVSFEVGAYGTTSGPFLIVGFGSPEDTASVYLEYPAGGAWVENAEDVERFTTMFADVSGLALSPEDSAELIRRQIEALKKL